MKNGNTRALKLTALGLVGFHFLTAVLHSVAHEVLSVEATPAQLAFIIPVIVVAPLIAGLALRKWTTAGAVLLLASMVGSLAFGLYYHFVADTIDHVAHVAQRGPAFWSATFRVTAYLLAVFELFGAAAAAALMAGLPRLFKQHATRTGL
jgi:hypothetical protein